MHTHDNITVSPTCNRNSMKHNKKKSTERHSISPLGVRGLSKIIKVMQKHDPWELSIKDEQVMVLVQIRIYYSIGFLAGRIFGSR